MRLVPLQSYLGNLGSSPALHRDHCGNPGHLPVLVPNQSNLSPMPPKHAQIP